MDVTFSEDAITDIVVKDHQETAGIADAAINDLPGEIVASQSLAVDAKSGATFTSEGIVNAVADAVAQAGGDADALRAVPVEKELSTETIEMTTDVVVVGPPSVQTENPPGRRGRCPPCPPPVHWQFVHSLCRRS